MIIKIECFTNLDDYKRELWPMGLPAVPQIGQRMQSQSGKELRIVSLCWRYDGSLRVELHSV